MTLTFRVTEEPASRRQWAAYYVRRAGAYALGVSPLPRTTGRLVAVCEHRSGSELLMSSLAASTRAMYDGEVFTTPALHAAAYLRGRARLAALRSLDYLCKLMTRQVREGMHYQSGRHLLTALHDDGFVIVRLVREDKIGQAVSSLRYVAAGVLHRAPGEKRPSVRVTVSFEDLVTVLRQDELNAQWAEAVLDGVPHVRVSYERDLSDPIALATTLERLSSEAGLRGNGRPYAPAVARTSGERGWRDNVTNAEEIAGRLAATRYAPLLSIGSHN